MATILRSVGGQFRLVGPLTTANGLLNPSFEAGLLYWTTVDSDGLVTPSLDTATVKFGSTSCKVSVATGAIVNHYYGVSQTLTETPVPGQDYTLSLYLFVPTDLPNSAGVYSVPVAQVYYFDDSNALLATHESQLTLGRATADWTKVSFTETSVPANTASAMVVIAVRVLTAGAGAFSFYLDGVVWSAGDSNEYVDGDFASYVWAGDQHTSLTLLSTAPDALASFRDDVHSRTPHHVVS